MNNNNGGGNDEYSPRSSVGRASSVASYDDQSWNQGDERGGSSRDGLW